MSEPQMLRFSYSHWSTYSECPRRWKYKNIDMLPTAPAGPAAQRGIMIHAHVDEYIAGGTDMYPPVKSKVHFPLLDQLREAEPKPRSEHKVEFTTNWIQAVNKADAGYVLILDCYHVPSESHVDIYEWKTGYPKDSYADQRKLYALGGLSLFPTAETVTVKTVYLDGTGPTEELEVKRSAEDMLKKLWSLRRNAIINDDFYPPRPGRQCQYCDFHRDKGGPCDGGTS